MNYQYIEQLLERYFDCVSTIEEEQILRSFFSQKDVPVGLLQYREMFVYQNETKVEGLGDDFDARMLSMIETEEKKGSITRIILLRKRLSPLFRAVAIVAVLISIGNIAEHSLTSPIEEERNNATAINPYIKGADIESVIQIKDVSRAEANPQTDSIPAIQSEND